MIVAALFFDGTLNMNRSYCDLNHIYLLFFFRIVNIFSGRSRRVSLAGVSPEQNVIPTDLPTTPPPTLPPPTCGSPYPPLRNLTGEAEEARLEGNDYIAFSATPEVLNFTRNR